MNTEQLQALSDRLEGLSGADRETDVLLHAELVDDRDVRWEGNMLLGRSRKPPHDECVLGDIDPGEVARNFSAGYSKPAWPLYTSSLDAVVALVERALPGWFLTLDRYVMDDLDDDRESLLAKTAAAHRWRVWLRYEGKKAFALAPTAPLAILRALVAAKIGEAKTRAKALSDLAEMDAEEIAAISTTSGVD